MSSPAPISSKVSRVPAGHDQVHPAGKFSRKGKRAGKSTDPHPTAKRTGAGTGTGAGAPIPLPLPGGEKSGRDMAHELVRLEDEMREARSLAELTYFMANAPRILTRARQIYVFALPRKGKPRVRAVTALANLDRSSPTLLWFEHMVRRLERDFGLDKTLEFHADAYTSEDNRVAQSYPLREMLWTPLKDMRGRVMGGLLHVRAEPWASADITIAEHWARACAQAWLAVTNRAGARARMGWLPRTAMAAAIALGIAALGFVPVPMTALAPAEVIPKDPFVVTAGVEGVVDQVLVQPNSKIRKGQPLIRMKDTVLRNRYELARREVAIANARYKKAAQLAFVDMRGRSELAIARAELQLKLAEQDHARSLLERTVVRAKRDGVAFYSDSRELVGRPVAIGERLMDIADPQSSQFRVDLPVSDAIVLEPGARIKVFLDSDPLHPVEAKLIRSDYRAQLGEDQRLAFRLIAEARAEDAKALRLGVRGTAQIFAQEVPLAFYLFRRPIAAARQWLGL